MMSNQDGERILKHPLKTRLFHWTLILGFLPAAITGFFIWLKPFSEDVMSLLMHIHIMGAWILSMGCLFYVVTSLDRIVSFLRVCFRFGKEDIEWFKVMGGYPQKIFLNKEVPVPPQDKINSGQKQFGLAYFFGGIAIILTGWILYAFIPVAPKWLVYWADMLHLTLGILLGLGLGVHIFLGVYNWPDFKAMIGDGTVPLDFAKHHTPLWVENDVEPVSNKQQGSNVSI